MSELKTPRTDAEEKFVYGHIDRKWTTSDFASTLERELNEAKAEVEDFKANNRYQRGYAHGERDEKKRTDQWRKVTNGLAHSIKVGNDHGYGLRIGDDALADYNKLKEGK